MNNKEKLIEVKNYIGSLYDKLSNEELLSEKEEKILSYIEFIMKFSNKDNKVDFTQDLQKYRSNR